MNGETTTLPGRQRPSCQAGGERPVADGIPNSLIQVQFHGWQDVPQGFAHAVAYTNSQGPAAWAIRTYRTVEPIQVLRDGKPERAAGSVVTIESLQADGYTVEIVPDDFQTAMLAAGELYMSAVMDSPVPDLDHLEHAERCLMTAQACVRDRLLTLKAKPDGTV